ncbi:hypothetical protein WA158_002617 [Blastocystis sp. Blastoise]
MSDSILYNNYEELEKARKSISASPKEFKGLFCSGYTFENVPVLSFIPEIFFDENKDNMNIAILQFFNFLTTYASKPYIVFVIFSPSITALPSIVNTYKIIPRNFRKNLKNLCIWKPTIYVNAFLYVFKPFISTKFFDKLIYFDNIQDIYLPKDVNSEIINMPALSTSRTVSLVEDCLKSTTGIPFTVEQCCIYLKKYARYTQGIFRIPGNTSIYEELLRTLLNDQSIQTLDGNEQNQHNVASALKKYFRVLEEGLIPDYIYDHALQAVEGFEEYNCIVEKSMANVLSKLPLNHLNTLFYICQFCNEMKKTEEYTLMNTTNLSIVFAPSILRAPSSLPPERALQDIGLCIKVLCILIDHCDVLFEQAKTIKQNSNISVTNTRNCQRSARVNLNDLNKLLQQNNVPINPTNHISMPPPILEQEEFENEGDAREVPKPSINFRPTKSVQPIKKSTKFSLSSLFHKHK